MPSPERPVEVAEAMIRPLVELSREDPYGASAHPMGADSVGRCPSHDQGAPPGAATQSGGDWCTSTKVGVSRDRCLGATPYITLRGRWKPPALRPTNRWRWCFREPGRRITGPSASGADSIVASRSAARARGCPRSSGLGKTMRNQGCDARGKPGPKSQQTLRLRDSSASRVTGSYHGWYHRLT
jgi:hypothetical protein